MILFITSSFPYAPDGISDSARFLYDNIKKKYDDKIILLTTNHPKINDFLVEKKYDNYYLIDDWKLNSKNKSFVKRIFDENPDINIVHMEYPGRYYGKTFLASILPAYIKKIQLKRKKKVTIHVRLHEFSKARFLRRIAILPILWKADKIYVPSLFDRERVKKYTRSDKIKRTIIGTNIFVDNMYKKQSVDKFVISYFGAVYEGKGIERLLSIWSNIYQKYGDSVSFKIIGELDPYNNNKFSEYHRKIFKLIESYGLTDKITITGYLEENRVSHEIIDTNCAMLLYEDGLTLRRGSFLAFLTHGTPIITVPGDYETAEIFRGCSGVMMCKDDTEIIDSVDFLKKQSLDGLKSLMRDNVEYSKKFDWEIIANDFIKSYNEG